MKTSHAVEFRLLLSLKRTHGDFPQVSDSMLQRREHTQPKLGTGAGHKFIISGWANGWPSNMATPLSTKRKQFKSVLKTSLSLRVCQE